MRVLVTGAAGLIGARTAALLEGLGHDVVGWDRRRLNTAIRDQRRLPPGTDAVIHCAAIARSAWPNDGELWDDNVAATAHLVRLLDGQPLVFASSSVVACPSSSVYAHTKFVAEHLVRRAWGTAVRLCNVYGPGQRTDGPGLNVLAAMQLCRRQNGYVEVHGDGSQAREFLHVDDAARALLVALDIAPGTYDARSPWCLTIAQVAHRFGCPVRHTEGRGDPPVLPATAVPLPGWSASTPPDDGMAYLWGGVHAH